MKKSLIAGAGVSALAFAALPFAGVFAAGTSSSFTDTLTVGVASGCTLENSRQGTDQTSGQPNTGDYTVSDRSFTAQIAAGTVGYLNADNTGAATTTEGTVSIQCNTTAASDAYTVTVTVDGLTDSGTSETIAGGNYDSGATSGWAIKSNASGATTNSFANYTAAPTAETNSRATFLTGDASATVTFNPSYKVYIAPDQEPGTYVGHAVYSIAMD